MHSRDAEKYFLDRLEKRNLELATLLPKDGVREMLEYYEVERATDCNMDADGDMLLFQWGTHNWGKGEYFDLNITRQIIRGDCEDDNIWQLALTFKYTPTDAYRSIKSSNKWCETTQDIFIFKKFIDESQAYRQTKDLTPAKVSFEFYCAG